MIRVAIFVLSDAEEKSLHLSLKNIGQKLVPSLVLPYKTQKVWRWIPGPAQRILRPKAKI
jgi:hypothetical protein